MTEANLSVVRKSWDIRDRRDLEGYMSTFVNHGIACDPVNQGPLRTREERRQFMEGLLAGSSEIHASIDFDLRLLRDVIQPI